MQVSISRNGTGQEPWRATLSVNMEYSHGRVVRYRRFFPALSGSLMLAADSRHGSVVITRGMSTQRISTLRMLMHAQSCPVLIKANGNMLTLHKYPVLVIFNISRSTGFASMLENWNDRRVARIYHSRYSTETRKDA